MADKLTKENEYEVRWVDAYFNHNFNGRITSKSLKPHLTMSSAEQDAARMLGKVRVQELIELKREHIRLKQDIKLEDIVAGLTRIITDCEQEQIERDSNGKITSKPDRKNALEAYKMLSKIAGFDAPKKIDINITSEQPLFGPKKDE